MCSCYALTADTPELPGKICVQLYTPGRNDNSLWKQFGKLAVLIIMLL